MHNAHGGDVILEADHDLNNLIAQYYQPKLIAQDGQGGMGKGMDGKAGKDLIIKVPCGTLVWRVDDDQEPADPTHAEISAEDGEDGGDVEEEDSEDEADDDEADDDDEMDSDGRPAPLAPPPPVSWAPRVLFHHAATRLARGRGASRLGAPRPHPR